MTITRRGAERLASGHPWIYRSDVSSAGTAAAGDVVRIRDVRGRFQGMAHYSSSSEIALRLLSTQDRPVDRALFQERLATAQSHRDRVVRNSNAYRLVFGEGDGLPALIVDRYAGWLVMQTLNQGMDRAQPMLVELLREMFPECGIIERNESSVRKLEKLPLRSAVVFPSPIPQPPSPAVRMNGLSLTVDLLKGQKTGAFLDQRENYVAAANWAKGHALDCFTYSGGFALHLARTCELVEAVDSSSEALAAARHNATQNGLSNISFTAANVFDLLKGYDDARRSFDTIVLDPPAFARGRAQLEGALRGYKEINLRAMKLLRPGGVLVTCTCSHHVGEGTFLEMLAEAALDAHRRITILERRTQSADHPILLTVPETLYLKCLILLVDKAW